MYYLSDHIVPSPSGPSSIGLNHGLYITGGEPFLHYEKLLEATRKASDLNVPSIFVETNLVWCREDKTTREKMEELKKAGLNGIMISVDPFYLEYVPFENTRRAVDIGREVFGGNAIIYQIVYLEEFESMGIEGTLKMNDYLEQQGGGLGDRVEFFLSGRAPYTVPRYDISGLTPRPPNWWFGRSCSPPFRREWHNHFDNYGNYIPGYCGGLSYGRIENLELLLSRGFNREKHPVLSLMVDNDFAGLYDLARDYEYRRVETGYYSRCHLCLDLRAFLHGKGVFSELKPDEFYRQLPDY